MASFLSGALSIKPIFVGLVFAFQLLVYSVKLLVAIVLRLEGLGVPAWLTLGSLALFPFLCLLAVRRLGTGQEMNTLHLADRYKGQDRQRSTSLDCRLIDPMDGSRFRPRLH